MHSIAGRYERLQIGDEEVLAFVPSPLPPRNPKISRPGQLSERLNAAEHALARLAFASDMIPCPETFLQAFARRDAVLSAQLDGLQVSLMDLLNDEAAEETDPESTVAELHNHIEAWHQARRQLPLAVEATGERPFSLLLLIEAHARLFRDTAGSDGQADQIRDSQTWIGGRRPGEASYVPPPAQRLPALLDDLEGYLNSTDKLPALVRIGLIQAQFESIHPYLAGNGRIARLLTTLLLEHWGFLEAPLPCLSLHFRRHQATYAERLAAVRDEGDWEGWIDFFLTGLAAAADEAVDTLRDLSTMISADRKTLLASEGSSLSALRLFERLPDHPVLTVATVMKLLHTSKPTAGRAIEALADAGILEEITGRKRDRSYAYTAFIDRLARGMEREQG